MSKEVYENPLIERYASPEICKIFSADFKFSTWRKLWVALAETEQELGLDITDEQIDELKSKIYDIDYDLDDGDRIMVDDSLYDDALDAFDEYDIEYEEV